VELVLIMSEDNLEQKAVDILDKIERLADHYAPEVVDSAVATVQIAGIGNLIQGLFLVVFAIAVFFISKRVAIYCFDKQKEEPYSDWFVGIVSSILIGGVLSFLMAFDGISEIIDVWNWIAATNPKLAIAYKIMGL
jgi:ABC-type Fe3+-siderophore transport system permease subunit